MAEITAIILAAGKGTRMQGSLPKLLNPVCGRPMIDYPLSAAKALGSKKIFVVTPFQRRDPVVQYLKSLSFVKMVGQKRALGTADAVKACAPSLNGFKGRVLILYGDCPLLRKETLKKFLEATQETDATLGLVTTRLENPQGYGRIVRGIDSTIQRVVEEREASAEEKAFNEVNTGVYSIKADWLFPTLKKLKPHPDTKEYYLTDCVAQAIQEDQKVFGFFSESPEEFLGVNTLQQLSGVNEAMRDKLTHQFLSKGVHFLDSRHVYLDANVQIGEGTVIYQQVALYGKTRIGKNCVVEQGSILKDMKVGDSVHIKPYCVLEASQIEDQAQVGPFARLRPFSQVGLGARVGNFVELKKTKLGKGVKANHLTYLGDAEIGDETNVGCGTITCNYDGRKKHPTKIGKKVFVGSDVQFVAPVRIEDGAYIGAGSTITEDVPSGALAVARGRQVNKKGWAKRKRK